MIHGVDSMAFMAQCISLDYIGEEVPVHPRLV